MQIQRYSVTGSMTAAPAYSEVASGGVSTQGARAPAFNGGDSVVMPVTAS